MSASLVAKVLDLNRSSLYIEEKRQASIAEQELTLKIFEIKREHKNYGYKRVKQELQRQNIIVNGKKVLRILRENKLLCPKKKPRKKFESIIKATYITSKLGINLIREIPVIRPYQVVQTDFTEIVTIGGKYHLIVYLCQYSKKVLSWAVSESENTETVIRCIKPALKLLDSESYVHQDQGSAFTSNQYVELLLKHDLYISYSRAATPTDNSEVESFFGRFKYEWSEKYHLAKSVKELRKIIKLAIQYYNKKRIHSTIKDIPQLFLNRELLSTNLSTHRGA